MSLSKFSDIQICYFIFISFKFFVDMLNKTMQCYYQIKTYISWILFQMWFHFCQFSGAISFLIVTRVNIKAGQHLKNIIIVFKFISNIAYIVFPKRADHITFAWGSLPFNYAETCSIKQTRILMSFFILVVCLLGDEPSVTTVTNFLDMFYFSFCKLMWCRIEPWT